MFEALATRKDTLLQNLHQDFVFSFSRDPKTGFKDQKVRLIPSSTSVDRLRVALGGVPREQKMLKGHLPRVMYHQVY